MKVVILLTLFAAVFAGTIRRPCDSEPCLNGGDCHNGLFLYFCKCKPGYTGLQCQKAPCDAEPCLNGGTCNNGEDGGYSCSCPDNFEGDHCEVPKGACHSEPCNNGGECVDVDIIEYKCNCADGFWGRNCDHAVPKAPCESQPCQNGGTCRDWFFLFYCQCKPGYTGKKCEHSPCDSSPCQNGGICHNGEEGGSTCECPRGFDGEFCEQQKEEFDCENKNNNPCAPDLLNEGQYYYPSGDKTKFVQCDAFGGCFLMPCGPGTVWDPVAYTCNHAPRDPCEPNPCENGGVCSDQEGSFSCECAEGYVGDKCDAKPPPSCDGDNCDGETPDAGPFNCGDNNPCASANSETGFYYTHTDPGKFVQCDAHGGCYEMPCGPGTVWNQKAYTCVHA